jgi:hypothetical protein
MRNVPLAADEDRVITDEMLMEEFSVHSCQFSEGEARIELKSGDSMQ